MHLTLTFAHTRRSTFQCHAVTIRRLRNGHLVEGRFSTVLEELFVWITFLAPSTTHTDLNRNWIRPAGSGVHCLDLVDLSDKWLHGLLTIFQTHHQHRPAELRCRGTISVEQSSCCAMETRHDSAHFQETTEGLSDVLVNRRNIHHHQALLWGFYDSGARYKTADLLTYLLITSSVF